MLFFIAHLCLLLDIVPHYVHLFIFMFDGVCFFILSYLLWVEVFKICIVMIWSTGLIIPRCDTFLIVQFRIISDLYILHNNYILIELYISTKCLCFIYYLFISCILLGILLSVATFHPLYKSLRFRHYCCSIKI